MTRRWNKRVRMTLVSFWGTPGSGKSTAAYTLMALLKHRDIRVAFAPEYALDCVWKGDDRTLVNHPLSIIAHQSERCVNPVLPLEERGEADVVITDSHPLMAVSYLRFYQQYHTSLLEQGLENFAFTLHNSDFNGAFKWQVGVFIGSPSKERFMPYGRRERSAKESRALECYVRDTFVKGFSGADKDVTLARGGTQQGVVTRQASETLEGTQRFLQDSVVPLVVA